MKVYISADIEGVTGTTHWDETQLSKGDYAPFREQMTAEVVAACAATSPGPSSRSPSALSWSWRTATTPRPTPLAFIRAPGAWTTSPCS